MSSSNCCFLTCIQISQEAGKVAWYAHLLKNFPQFVMIHTVKGFGIVNKAEVDVFLELPCSFNEPTDVSNLISGSSAFSKSSLFIWKFSVHCWSTVEAWRILSITLLAYEMSTIVSSYCNSLEQSRPGLFDSDTFFFFTVCMHFYFKKLFGSVTDKSKHIRFLKHSPTQ